MNNVIINIIKLYTVLLLCSVLSCGGVYLYNKDYGILSLSIVLFIFPTLASLTLVYQTIKSLIKSK